MKLIDADKLIELFNKKYGDNENINESVFYLIGAISGASTVDAVEVVRCKECKWFHNCREDGWGKCGEHDDYGRDSGWWQATDFCSWGVKK